MMPAFEEREVCRARAEEVFKLLWDPTRFPEWWAGMDRVESDNAGEVTRYMSAWPDFAYPTRVAAAGDGCVTISCLLSDIVHEWSLAPHPGGCVVSVRVALPETEAERLDAQRAEVSTSLARLVALAEEQ